MSNTNNTMSTMSAADRKDLTAWKASATKARNRSGELLVRFAGYLKDGNTSALTELTRAICEVRGYSVDAFVQFVLYHTGGDDGLSYAPERSVLRYNVQDISWSIRRVDLSKEQREACNGDKDAEKAARAELVEAQQTILARAQARMGKGEWWIFAPEKPKSPYNVKSLISALKRANENRDDLTTEQRAALDEMLLAAEKHGMFE